MSDRLPVHFLTPGAAGQTIVTTAAGAVEWGAASGGGGASGEFGGAVLSKAAGQVLTAGTETAVTFSAEISDTGGFHDTVTNTTRLTAPTDGPYLVGGTVEVSDLPANAGVIVRIRKNGVNATGDGRARLSNQTGFPGPGLVRPIDMVAGDYVELTVEVSAVASGVTAVRPSSSGTSFWITRLAADAGAGVAGDIDGGTPDSTYLDFIDGGTP